MRSAALDDLPKLYRSEAICRIEREAMARFALDEDDLMARAGLSAWRLLLQRWPQAQRIGVACGPGNNGGDGYVLAELARASGRDVHVVRLGDAVRAGPAQRAATAYVQAGGATVDFCSGAALPEADVWVDALFGIGLHRALDAHAQALVASIQSTQLPVLALDVPSGLDADTGCADATAMRATTTLCYIAGKPGLFTGQGRALAGDVVIDTLGLAAVFADDGGVAPAALLARPDALPRWFAPRARTAHKGHHGHVLCIGGDHGYGGAIALSAEAALRSGAGLVSAATRAQHVSGLLARRPECMTHALEDANDLRPLAAKADALAIGPGLGRSDWSRDVLEAAAAVAATQRAPWVIDADAIHLLAQGMLSPGRQVQDVAAAPSCVWPAPAVWTPHPGEAAGLLNASTADIERDRVASAQRLAALVDSVVIWKGAGTVVVAPDQVPVIIDAGNPGMAVGGMGDVLTGVVASLLAQGWSCFDAALGGALLHAAAGDLAAAAGGERGLLPSDLFACLRRLVNPGCADTCEDRRVPAHHRASADLNLKT